MPHERSVLITGGTGALGPAVMRCFSRAGWGVRTFSRHAPAPGTPGGAHPHHAGDIEDEVALAGAMQGVDVVVHMAALLHVANPSPRLQAEYLRVNVAGTSALLRVAKRAGVCRVILLSSTTVYGATVNVVDETARPAPDSLYASSKLEAERIGMEAAAADGAPLCTVMRLAAVYGPHVKGNYERLVRALARHRFWPVGAGTNRRTLVFEDDAARAILLAAVHPAAAGRVFNVSDGEIHSVAEITAAICRALGRRPPLVRLPLSVARGLAGTAEVACRVVGGRSPLTRAMLQKYTEHSAVSCERIRAVLGFEPEWSLEEGWRQTVLKLKEAGRL